MSNLLHSEYENCSRDLLGLLSKEDLNALVKTATGGRVQTVNRKESCTAILQHSPDVAKLFSYRKITLQLLKKYLSSQGSSFQENASRTELVMAVTEHWDKQVKREPVHKILTPVEPRRSLDEQDFVSRERRATHQQPDSNITKISIVNAVSNNHYHSPSSNERSFIPFGSSSFSTNASISVNSDLGAVTASFSSFHMHSHNHLQSNTGMTSDVFSLEFCNWFYSMLNRFEPQCGAPSGDTLRSGIFCNDYKIEMYLLKGGKQEVIRAEGGGNCERTISDLLKKLHVMFVPNTTNGTHATRSAVNGIQLFCCGTMLSRDSLCGIFEQEFGLILSPVDNTWKITYTKVNLKMENVVKVPSLPPSERFVI